MQLKRDIIQILDTCGEIIGSMNLSANIKLADLAPLKMLGGISVKVLPCFTPFSGINAGGAQ
jgi:hypothetical protein